MLLDHSIYHSIRTTGTIIIAASVRKPGCLRYVATHDLLHGDGPRGDGHLHVLPARDALRGSVKPGLHLLPNLLLRHPVEFQFPVAPSARERAACSHASAGAEAARGLSYVDSKVGG